MPDHGGPERLKEDLLTLAELPSAPADPMPAIRRRIVRRRRRRATLATAGIAAMATVAVAAGWPILSNLQAEPGPPAVAPPDRVQLDPPDPATEEQWGGRGEWRDEVASGPEFPDYGDGEQGSAYVVKRDDAGRVVVSHWLNGTGDPCLALVTAGADERFCFEGWPEGKQATWKTLGGKDGVVVGFVAPDVRRVGIKARAEGNLIGVTDSAPVVGTPTSADLSYFVEPMAELEILDVAPYRELPPDFTLPEPWSDRKFTEMPMANTFTPVGYYVAEGEVDGRPWGAISDRGIGTPCLTIEPQGVFDAAYCFDEEGPAIDWGTQTGVRGSKPNYTELDESLTMGVVPVEARTVEIETADGQVYPADAVGTPSSDAVRFFATVVPQQDAEVVEVRALDADGNVVGEGN